MVDKIWYNMEELIGGSEERVLIETQWNVKNNLYADASHADPVLIETQWNVKVYDPHLLCLPESVLIETQWNVKFDTRQNIILHTMY